MTQLDNLPAQESHPGVLRAARAEDLAGIQLLIRANAATLLQRPDEEILEIIDQGLWWVIDEDGVIVGTCCLELYSRKIAELRTLAVRDEARGHGYGRMLCERAVAVAKSRNIHQVLVVTSNREFFEGVGFGACLNEKYALFWDGEGRQ
jgi:amino-acid N-acetyltransferase